MTPWVAFGNDPTVQRESWRWTALALASLALAGLFALLLALSRAPIVQDFVPWPQEFFRKALVVHVVFAFVVWFLAAFATLCHLAAVQARGGLPRLNALGGMALACAGAAFLLLLVPALLDRGQPTLNNYVPVIIDPLFYAGLAALAVGLGLAVVRLFANLDRAALGQPLVAGAVAGGLLFAVAVLCALLAWQALDGRTPDHAFNEDLFWGAGHVLQFLNAVLLVTAWQLLTADSLGRPALRPGLFAATVGMLALAGAMAPLFYVLYPAFSADQRDAFTNLQYLLAPPTLLIGIGIAVAVAAYRKANARLPWADPGFLGLILSLAVFALGGGLGLFVDGADTRTPAHYHAVIIGIILALIGLFHRLLLPLLGRSTGSGLAIRVQIWLLGAGQATACLGLFWAGGYGAPRKLAGAEQGLDGIAQVGGMAMNGIGGVVAVIGGIMFIWTAGRALMQKGPEPRGQEA